MPQEVVFGKEGGSFRNSFKGCFAEGVYPTCKIVLEVWPSAPTLKLFNLEQSSLSAKALLYQKMLDHGFFWCHPTALYLMYAHKEEHHKKNWLSLDIVLKEIENHWKWSRPNEEVRNKRGNPNQGFCTFSTDNVLNMISRDLKKSVNALPAFIVMVHIVSKRKLVRFLLWINE